MEINITDSGAQSAEGEVGLIVEGGSGHVCELTDGVIAVGEHGICAGLAEAQVGVLNTTQADFVCADGEVHHELLCGRQVAKLTDDPENIAAGATIEVVGAGTSQDNELIVPDASEGPVACATDDEVIIAAAAITIAKNNITIISP